MLIVTCRQYADMLITDELIASRFTYAFTRYSIDDNRPLRRDTLGHIAACIAGFPLPYATPPPPRCCAAAIIGSFLELTLPSSPRLRSQALIAC